MAAHAQQVEPFFRITLAADGGALSLRILPGTDARIKAIGQEDDRAAAPLLLDVVRTALRLLTALGYIHADALSFRRQCPTVIAMQHIVRLPAQFIPGRRGKATGSFPRLLYKQRHSCFCGMWIRLLQLNR